MMEIICIEEDSPAYPALLKEIKDPPKRLYAIGDPELARGICAAVVGSRKGTPYGRWAAGYLGEKLAAAGAVVVSGMAGGADTEAHKGALRAGGKTIAVLGCGPDVCYPPGNRELHRRIGEEGLILSEYPPGMPPRRGTFPARNRIISGISRLVAVAEAGLNSGSLITAGLAADQGRELFAVPGNINSIYSIGCNKLIRDGATPVVAAEDLLDCLGLLKAAPLPENMPLSPEERRLIRRLSACSEASLGDLAGEWGCSLPQISALVTVLEMKGILRCEMGKVYLTQQVLAK